MDFKYLEKEEKNLNTIIQEIWKQGIKLSEEIGEKVQLDLISTGEYEITKKINVRIPRPCGCCEIYISDSLDYHLPDLKELVSKIRKVEEMVVNYDDSYDIMYDIYIPINLKQLRKLQPEEIFNLWKKQLAD